MDYSKYTDEELRLLHTQMVNDISKYHNLQLAMKVNLNSAYGAIGNEYFRFFDIRIAEAVTTSGQLAIRWIQQEMNAYLNKILDTKEEDFVIASDTDSMYLNLERLIDKVQKGKIRTTEQTIDTMNKVCNEVLQPFIEKAYKRLDAYVNSYASKMKMKREALADRAIWTGKKHYMMNVWDLEGVRFSKPKLKITGLEAVKAGSLPTEIREKIKKAYDIIITKDRASLIEFVEEYRTEFKSKTVEEISIPRGCNGLTKYHNSETIWGIKTPFHVRGALMFNKLLKINKLTKQYQEIKEGDKIKYTYLKEPNTIQCNVISFTNILPKELGLHQYVDYDTMFNKVFVDPVVTILNAIGWKLEETSSLDLFFE